MNLILLTDTDFMGAHRVRLTGRRHLHVRKVLKAAPGDVIACGRVNGRIGTGTLTRMAFDVSEMTVDLTLEPPEPLPLKLVLAMPRPKMLKRIIQNVTSLGVKEIYLVNSWRVEKSFWQSPLLADEKLANHMMLGLEQARDTVLPKLYKKRFFARFVKDELPGISRDTVCLAAHPKAGQTCPQGINRPVTLAVGPEGGWIEPEIETFENIGFASRSIGPRILTVETAVTFLISRLYT